jgi:hypothetical protein
MSVLGHTTEDHSLPWLFFIVTQNILFLLLLFKFLYADLTRNGLRENMFSFLLPITQRYPLLLETSSDDSLIVFLDNYVVFASRCRFF